MQYQGSPRPQQRPEIVATENSVATEIQYSVKPLDNSGLQAVHYRVRRLFLWGHWEPMRDPTFFSYDAACRYLGTILREKNVLLYDPVVLESYTSDE